MNNDQVHGLRLLPSSGPVDWEPVCSLTPDEANRTSLQNILFAKFKVQIFVEFISIHLRFSLE